jgi:hypothetical protein
MPPYWAVARTAPHHERLAVEGVGQAGFETFVPRIRVKVGAQWRTTPLFGCYFFVRVVDRWRILERTMGVLSVVKFGASPARVPDAEIAGLLDRADPDGIIRLGDRHAGVDRRKPSERAGADRHRRAARKHVLRPRRQRRACCRRTYAARQPGTGRIPNYIAPPNRAIRPRSSSSSQRRW